MEASEQFERATTEYLADLYAAEPVMATAMGVHDHDDQLPCYEPYAIADELRRARAYLHAIDRLSLSRMDADGRIDYRLARANTQVRIAQLEKARPLERQPGAYVDTALFGAYLLMARDFAPAEQRAVALLGRLRSAPVLFRQARENLKAAPRLFVEIGLEEVEGGRAFFSEAMPEFAATLRNERLREAVLEANADALEALCNFGNYLREALLPGAGAEFALGRELFDYVLRVGHLLDESSAELVEIGLEELRVTREEMERTAWRIDPAKAWQEIVAELKRDHPPAAELVQAYADEMARARDFVVAQGLVGLPENESLTVTETPAFERAMLPYAAYVPSAPFEKRQAGIFWVTPVDARLNAEQREAQLQGHSRFNMPIIALHEAYPGHHLQMSRANQHPSRFRRHFGDSNLFLEGWALYCEEMMYGAGFYADPRVRLMQLKGRLWRACRVVVDVRLHAGEMSFEEAVAFMVEHAGLEEPNARAEVRRYAVTPTQPMSYLMGKRQILDLRARMERKQGARFDLRAFHDALLSYGSVQPRLIREAMFSV